MVVYLYCRTVINDADYHHGDIIVQNSITDMPTNQLLVRRIYRFSVQRHHYRDLHTRLALLTFCWIRYNLHGKSMQQHPKSSINVSFSPFLTLPILVKWHLRLPQGGRILTLMWTNETLNRLELRSLFHLKICNFTWCDDVATSSIHGKGSHWLRRLDSAAILT